MSAEPERRRADVLLVERGVFESRARAQEAIAAGLVSIGGAAIRKPSEMVKAGAEIAAAAPHPWVSRGGIKLAAALEQFGISPSGRVCLDVGASTGGFTDVLLTGGARRVYAVDVGHGQLHPKIARDDRVVALEGVDARRLGRELVPEPVDLVVVDVSFISLKLVLASFMSCLSERAHLVALVKPQFEVGRDFVGRGGLVRDEDRRQAAIEDVASCAGSLGWQAIRSILSPIAGGDGNREFLLAARLG